MLVSGEGPQPCLAMVVGGYPSVAAGRKGRPFADDEGRALDIALRAEGLSRADVYCTYVVKNVAIDDDGELAVPSESDVRAWLPLLAREIESTVPRAILALGGIAAAALTGIEDVPSGSKIDNVYVVHRPGIYTSSRGAAMWASQIRPWAEALLGN